MRNLGVSVLVLASLSLSILCFSNEAPKAVLLFTLEWDPYIGESLPQQGYVGELVDASFAASGCKASFKFLPWARAVDLARSGASDGYLPEYYDDSRSGDFEFSDEFPGGALVLYKRKGLDFAFSGRTDELHGLKIGVVRGYLNTKGIDESRTLIKEEASTDLANMKKLAAGRLDLIVIDRLVAESILKADEFKGGVSKVELVSPILEYKPLYICFSKIKPGWRERLAAFNHGLARIKASGELERILYRHGIPPSPKP